MTDLFDPLTLPSGLTLPNRLAKSALTENLAERGNQPGVRLERLYRRWAAGGAGLLVTGNLMVDRRYLERTRNVVADAHVDPAALARLAAAGAGTPFLAQINHPGRQCTRYIAATPVAPSAVDAVHLLGSFGKPRELTGGEVEGLVEAYAATARRCHEAGFDGVQVHAAHGYLLAQFLSPHTNQRTDQWGGDVKGRARALLEIVRACREATSETFTLAVKLNSSDFRHGGFTQDDAELVVGLLASAGIDLIEISGGTYESPALFGLADGQQPTGVDGDRSAVKEAYFAEFAGRAKQAAPDVPIMLTGGIRTRSVMDTLLVSGAVDVIGLGRPLIADPDFPQMLAAGAPGITLPSYSVPKLLEVVGESEWYEAQIGRMGDGHEPDPGLGRYSSALKYVFGEMFRGYAEGRARRTLAAR